MEAETTGNTSLLQILAGADAGDEEDVAIREGLLAALRDFVAGNAAIASPGRRKRGANACLRHHRRAASGDAQGSCRPRRLLCTFRS
jgi:hypothetical protein